MPIALSEPRRLQKTLLWLLLIGLMLFTAAAQFGLLVEISTHDINVAMPYLLGEGMPLYTEVTSFHPPLISWLMALIYQLNPDVLFNVRLLNVILIIGTGLLIYWTGKRIWGATAGIISMIFFLLWSINYNTIYFYLDALIGCAALLITFTATFRRSIFTLILMGIFGGVAALFKQSGLAVLFAPLVWLVLFNDASRRSRLIHAGVVLASALLTYAAQFFIYAINGIGAEANFFLFNPGSANWLGSLSQFFDGVALRTVSLTLVFIPAYFLIWLRETDGRRMGGLLWLLAGATALLNIPVPGYYHMMAPLPIVALMSGAILRVGFAALQATAIQDPAPSRFKRMQALLVKTPSANLALTGVSIGLIGAMLVTALTPMFVVFRSGVKILGWDELQPISAWVQQNVALDEQILVLPAYDTNGNLYPQSGRLPPYYMKTWFYHARFPANVERLTQAVTANPPTMIVLFVDLYASVEQYFSELDTFIAEHYEQVGQIEDIPLQGTVIFLRYAND